ncbi:hypothetical protein AF332_11755 [Sporosarcina globispora]|uniref:Uncharacterized protein n=1 Tax=Sporosarcina globispora TaxID=1459 RepID=A0A0M0GBZ0_SPOGL|nr:hypothetical protein [Sporosarcina globispora]KON87435.1 hypothetical protein AF332_11755 [Sporosarcina globispora]
MSNYKMILSNLIKSFYYQFPNKIQIKSDQETIKFELDYYAAEKVAKKLNRVYYFGTEVRFNNEREFRETYKELLKVKRALKEIYTQ